MFKIYIIILLSTSSLAFSQNIKSEVKDLFVANEIIVKFKKSAAIAQKLNTIKNRNGIILKELNKQGLSHIEISEDQTVQSAIDSYKLDPNVEYVQPNYIYKISTVPNDPNYNQQWALKNTGQTITNADSTDSIISTNNPGSSGKDMNLESAWSVVTDCSSITVAVIDSGVNYNHADLAANMWNGGINYPNHGYNYITPGNALDPMDKNGHGTHVAGIIGAVGNNNIGTTGICWSTKIMAIRVMDAFGSGTTANIISGIDFAATNGAKIINMSLGGTIYDAAFNAAITSAQAKGVIVVVAAGNETNNNETSARYPCNFTQSNLICVAALDQSYNLASYSNYGSTSVDVGAPGSNIRSTWPGTHTITNDNLTTGWTFPSSGWGYKALNFGTSSNCLVNPFNYNHTTSYYANNANEHVWKSFDISGADVATMNVAIMYDLETNLDFLKVYGQNTTGDPVTTGTLLTEYFSGIQSFTGSTGGARGMASFDLTGSGLNSATTSIGFGFSSNPTSNDFGINLSLFSIKLLKLNTTSSHVASGTSMASPQVAGLAALVWAYNPNYTYQEVISSVINGGNSIPSLTGKTTTGKAINAMGALSFIQPPTGVTAVKL